MIVCILTIAFTFLRINQLFDIGYGQFDLLTNWLMGISFGLFISFGFLALLFFLEDLSRLKTSVKTKSGRKNKPVEPTRRRFIAQMGLGMAAFPFLTVIYGMWKEKYNFQLRKQTLTFEDLPAAFDGFKIVQFSDVHSGSFDDERAMQNAVDLIADQQADLIVFTGDWVNNFAEELEPYIPLFKKLSAPFGKFAILGNHDYGEEVEWPDETALIQNAERLRAHIDKMGFKQLNNANEWIAHKEDGIRLIGVENWGLPPRPQKGDLTKAIEGTQDDEFSILLSHDPNHWDKKILPHPKHFHLTLSGHTHGSQIGIETKWIKWTPVQYYYPRWAGLYQEAKQYLYVNRGLGFFGYAGRIGIPPEITLITLKTA